MRRVSRRRLMSLRRSVGLDATSLVGSNRIGTSTRRFASMCGPLSDPIEYFRKCMSIELEHGTANPRTDVTHDNLHKTAKIVAAHILGVEHGEDPRNWTFFPSYYDWLMHMEKKGPR